MPLFSCGQQLKITKIPTRENFGPTKYPREKILDPQNTHEEQIWTYETPTRKNLRTTKYPRENILDTQNTHEKTPYLDTFHAVRSAENVY